MPVNVLKKWEITYIYILQCIFLLSKWYAPWIDSLYPCMVWRNLESASL